MCFTPQLRLSCNRDDDVRREGWVRRPLTCVFLCFEGFDWVIVYCSVVCEKSSVIESTREAEKTLE